MSDSPAVDHQDGDAAEPAADEQQRSWLSRVFAALARILGIFSGRETGAGSDLRVGDATPNRADISVHLYSRFPDLDDYDQDAYAWRDSYVDPPNGYAVNVSACSGVEKLIDDEETERIVREIERERRRDPSPGGSATMPDREEAPRDNVGGRIAVPDDFVAWHWTITDAGGNEVTTARRRAKQGPASCGADILVPDLGRYDVDLRLELEDGQETDRASFTIRDEHLVVLVGDSYASGEGNPDEPCHPTPDGDKSDPVWLDSRGHRSLQSGAALAAEAFEERRSGELVTFLSFANSGAQIYDGLIRDQFASGGGGPPEGDPDKRLMLQAGATGLGGQLDEVDQTVGDRTIDALIISIGGNDVGFADGLKDLLYRFWETRSETVSETEEAISRLVEPYENGRGERLPAKYDRLAERIDALEADVEHVLLTEYPVAMFDADDDGTVGEGCGALDPLLLNELDVQPTIKLLQTVLPNISADDARAIKDLGIQLNLAVEAAADRHGWTYVDGIADGFEGHGYCRSEEQRYFVTASESWEDQDDVDGIMHPNHQGHEVYRDRILDALERTVGRPTERDDEPTDRGDDSSRDDDGTGSGDDGTGNGDDGGTGSAVGDDTKGLGDPDRRPKRRE